VAYFWTGILLTSLTDIQTTDKPEAFASIVSTSYIGKIVS